MSLLITTVLGWTLSLKNRGDRAECLAARFSAELLQVPLIPAIVAPNLHDVAIRLARVRLDSGNLRNLDSNGDANNLAFCSLFHISDY